MNDLTLTQMMGILFLVPAILAGIATVLGMSIIIFGLVASPAIVSSIYMFTLKDEETKELSK